MRGGAQGTRGGPQGTRGGQGEPTPLHEVGDEDDAVTMVPRVLGEVPGVLGVVPRVLGVVPGV